MKIVIPAFIAAALLLTTASSALADDRIALSRDGEVWSTQLSEPLFDPDVRWVPGDTRTESFFVRNESPESAELSIDLLGSAVDGLVKTGDLTVMASGGGSGWTETDESGTQRLVSNVGVGSASGTRVDVTVAFDADAVNVSQTLGFELDLRVNLQESLPGTSEPATPADGDGDGAGDGAGDGDGTGDGGDGNADTGDSDADSGDSADADSGGAEAGDGDGGDGGLQPESGGLLPDTGGFGFWILVAGLSLLVMGIAATSTRRQEEGTHV